MREVEIRKQNIHNFDNRPRLAVDAIAFFLLDNFANDRRRELLAQLLDERDVQQTLRRQILHRLIRDVCVACV